MTAAKKKSGTSHRIKLSGEERIPASMTVGGAVSDDLPIQGYISIKSKGGKSVFSSRKTIPKSCTSYHYSKADGATALKAIEKMGFTILTSSRIGVAVTGPKGAYEELTGATVTTKEILVPAEMGQTRFVSHLDIEATEPKQKKQPGECGLGMARTAAAKIEGIYIERPRILHAVFPSPIPPKGSGFYLRVPDDVSLGLGASGAHRSGVTGEGVEVAMVDSGQFPHPFFSLHGYEVLPPQVSVPNTDPIGDPVGHGTGESANIFAMAPDIQLQAYRAADNNGNLVGAIGGFLMAKDGAPDILTNSWGGNGPFPPPGDPSQADIAFAIEILDAIDQGIFVVFSAGNGSFTIEPQVPGVFAAGGVFMEPDLDFRASNYASGYDSPWVANRTVPDACGFVGNLPRAQYIMLPVPPGSELDVLESQPSNTDPDDDGTGSNDGWALFSGTSAAAPQIAGAAALILSAKPGLSPAQVSQALISTATDIQVGSCHPRFNNQATVGQDNATGHGLVNASRAVQFAIDNF